MKSARTVVIPGANRGLGLEFTRQLLARGHRVVAGCRQPGHADALTQLAAAHPGHLHIAPLDVAEVLEVTRQQSVGGDDELAVGVGGEEQQRPRRARPGQIEGEGTAWCKSPAKVSGERAEK